MSTVLVTGANGYIAQWIVKYLIENGFRVVGTVRSKEKGSKLAQALGNPVNLSFEIVTDLADPHAFDKVLQDHPEITTVLHTALPFTFSVEDPERDILQPGITGTKLILEAIVKYAPQVTRVVITSSLAAARPEEDKAGVVVNEETWTFIDYEVAKLNTMLAYFGLKPLAERAAWDFVSVHKPNFTLCTILPGFVFGPQADIDEARKATLNQLMQVIDEVLQLTPDNRAPSYLGPWIDVRDTARAHLVAMTEQRCQGERLLLVKDLFHVQDVVDAINKRWPGVWVGNPGLGPERLAKRARYDALRTHRLLGFPLRTLEQSVTDSVEQLKEARKDNGKL